MRATGRPRERWRKPSMNGLGVVSPNTAAVICCSWFGALRVGCSRA
jgi:hypothetical protein